MFSLNKKSGFTLAEIMITLGLVGAISAMVIPTLAYNYKAKVLEQQFRDTYAEIKQIGSMINYENGDVGEYANKLGYRAWAREFISRLNGGNALCEECSYDKDESPTTFKRRLYRQAGSSQGPYQFNLVGGRKSQVGDICDNAGVWTDSKGRIWTFNAENRMICVDINGTANPNRINIDTFAFIPMSSDQVAVYLHNDSAENASNYSGQFAVCDLQLMTTKGLSNYCPIHSNGKCLNGETSRAVALERDSGAAHDACPFNEPLENVAPLHSARAGLSAKNTPVTATSNYWKDYINYK